MKYLMGIDIGTTGCKVNIYNKELESYGSSYRGYNIISTKTGWVEEDPVSWWQNTKDAIKECLKENNVLSRDVLAVGVSCTNGIVAVQKDGENIYNAIMQIDNRSILQAEKIKELVGSEEIFRITGNRIAQGTFSAPIILWLKENEPKIYERTFKFLSPTGFIVQKMTNAFTFDHTRASTTLLYDIDKKVWSSQICKELGIDISKLPDIYKSEEVVGGISKRVSIETGLSEGMPVVAGVMDSVAASVGLGTMSTSNPALIIGTVARLCIPQTNHNFDERFLNSAFITEVPYLSMAPVNAGGLSIKWFIDNFLNEEATRLQGEGVDYYDYFDERASIIPPGSNSLVYLPYLVGERSPIWDTEARGVFFGIQLKHTKYDFYRAIMEGVALAIRHNLEIYTEKYDLSLKAITISGGGGKSKLWSSIFADVLGIPIVVPDDTESETKGSAIFAGYGIGIFDQLNVVMQKETKTVIQPNFSNTKMYDLLFDVYKKLYCSTKESFIELNEIANVNKRRT